MGVNELRKEEKTWRFLTTFLHIVFIAIWIVGLACAIRIHDVFEIISFGLMLFREYFDVMATLVPIVDPKRFSQAQRNVRFVVSVIVIPLLTIDILRKLIV